MSCASPVGRLCSALEQIGLLGSFVVNTGISFDDCCTDIYPSIKAVLDSAVRALNSISALVDELLYSQKLLTRLN